METKVPYLTVSRRHSREILQVIDKLRAGRSKHRNDPPHTFEWGYSWCVEVTPINGHDFMEIVAGRKAPPKREKPKTAQAYVADYARRAHVTLYAKKGRASWYSEKLVEFPDEVAQVVRKMFEEDERLEKEAANMTPAEEAKLLRDVMKMPGMMVVPIPVSRRAP